jgi:alpha-tubulin suppressor-like RCC1 family protein
MHLRIKRALCVLVSLSILLAFSSILTLSTTASAPSVDPCIAIGNNFMVVQTTKGELWGWGDNSGGVLGDPQSAETNENITTPVKINLPGIHSVAVSAGYDHVLMLGSDGNVYAWGKNDVGQLGIDTPEEKIEIPTLVDKLCGKNITAIAAGKRFSLALSEDGTVYSFGLNNKGQLGYASTDGSAEFSATPTKIKALNGISIAQITAGYESAIAIAQDGQAYLWGSTKNYLLGVYETSNPLPPTLMTQTTSVISAALTNTYSAFLLENGTVGFMGSNAYGQYGNGDASENATTVFKVTDTSALNIKDIAVSDQQTVLLGTNGKVYTAGNRLQNNAESASKTFVPLFGEDEKTAIAIAAGYKNGAMIASDGSVWVWGSNSCGQLGNGTGSNDGSATPTKVLGSDDFSYITDTVPHEKDVPIRVTTSVPAPKYAVVIPSTVNVGQLQQTDEISPSRYSWTQFDIQVTNVENLFGEKAIRVWVQPGEGDSFCLQDGNGNAIPFELFPHFGANSPIPADGILKEFTKNEQDEVWIRIDQSKISKTGVYSGIMTFHYTVVNIPQSDAE